MKIVNTVIPKKNKEKVSNGLNQKNTPTEEKRGKNINDTQNEFIQRVKEDIKRLHKEGYSIRMITNHYNDLYATRDANGQIAFDAISRETVRKILNDEFVSMKSIIRNQKLLF